MAEDRIYVPYPFRTPRMDASVPPNQVKPGSFGRLSGVDGRFYGGLRKFYGMKEVLDLDDVTGMKDIIDANHAPDFIRYVTFQQRGEPVVYRGFVIRWDKEGDPDDEQIDLIYIDDNGGSWTQKTIWAAGASHGILSSLEIDCAVSGSYLLVAVDTKATKTIYWDGDSLEVIDSGPGIFNTELGTPTFKTSAIDTETPCHLRGNGTYQIAYRFYDSTRGIYSALSAPLVEHLDHYKTTKAVGTISFVSGTGTGGMTEGDVFTINDVTYEYISGGSTVTISTATDSSLSAHATALADAINGYDSAGVTASAQTSSVLIEAIARGTGGNAYTLSKVEVEPNRDNISVSGSTLSGGGVVTAEAETQVKITIDFPDNTAVISGSTYAKIAALFDKVDIFRTIDLGDTTVTQGAIFYLEQTLDMPASAELWNALTTDIGILLDEALPFQTMYDPEKDIIDTPPQSGTIGRYSNLTFMAQAASEGGGYDTLSSSPEHISPEYFSTYNKRVGDPEDGRPLRFIPAGDSLFQLCYNAIVHIFKSGKLKPLQFSRLHKKRGIVGKEVAHSSGNSVFMITGLGLVILNATDGGMGSITAADRVIFDDWKSEISDVKSCYDSVMNASFFLNPTRREMIVLWHSTQVCTMLDGANFVGATSGPDITSGKNDRAYFITATGLIVSPDNLEAGSGTMWDLDSGDPENPYTLNGTATATSTTTLTDATATLNDDMIGARLYMTSGANAGDSREIDDVDTENGIFSFIPDPGNFDNEIATGDTYAVSPVPFSLRAWRLQHEEVSPFTRWITSGVALKVRKLLGFDDNVNNKWRVGAYRNGETSIESTVAYPNMDSNPADSAEGLNLEGIDLEPYIEQIASGVKFELTDAEFAVALTDSRKVSAS